MSDDGRVRSALGTVLEVVGAAGVLAATYAFDVRAAIVLVGVGMIAAGYAISDPRRARKG